MGVIPGVVDILAYPGVPGAGTTAIQTITFGGTPTGGTFRLAFEGFVTADIDWSATNNTLRDNVDAALEALPSIGTSGVATAVGTMTNGVGTLTVTFSGTAHAKLEVPDIMVDDNSLTSDDEEDPATVDVETTTPGVTATFRGLGKGCLVSDTTNGVLYINTGTALAPTFTKVGTQS